MSVCPSQGFTKLNVNHKRDLGVIELSFRNASRRPMINLQGCIVSANELLTPGDSNLSPKNFLSNYCRPVIKIVNFPTMVTRIRFFSKMLKIIYWPLRKLHLCREIFINYNQLTIRIVVFTSIVSPIWFFQTCSKLFEKLILALKNSWTIAPDNSDSQIGIKIRDYPDPDSRLI